MKVEEPTLAYGKRYTIAEYLEFENASQEKHEYYNGDMIDRSGRTGQHNIVSGNLLGSLWLQLKSTACRPYNCDQRIHVEKTSFFAYPDVSVFCAEPKSLNDDDMNFLNPSVIFEVTSPGSTDYEHGTKFELYREISTLQEYILVDPATVRIEAFFVNARGNWELREYKDINDSLALPTIDLTLPLSEIYEGIALQ